MYKAKFEDGEWLVVDDNDDVVDSADGRRNAVLKAASMNKGSGGKPGVTTHRGSSYGNKPDGDDLDESSEEKNYTMIVGKSGNSGMTANNPNNFTKKRTVRFTASDWDSAKEKINSLLKPGEYVTHLYDDASDEYANNQVSEGVSDNIDKAIDYMYELTDNGQMAKRLNGLNRVGNKLTKESDEMIGEGGRKQEADPEAAHELVLFADNDSDLYSQSALPIIANLQRNVKSGKYDHELAIKLWRYHADRAAMKYKKEFGDNFSPATRDLAAKEFRDNYDEEVRGDMAEEVNEENLQELSKGRLSSYLRKAMSSSHKNSASNLASMGGYKYGKYDGDDNDDGEADEDKSIMRSKGMSRALDRLIGKEDVQEETLDELSKDTLGRYVKAASYDNSMASFRQGVAVGDGGKYHKVMANTNAKRSLKREKGIGVAVNKLTKESVVEAVKKAYIATIENTKTNKTRTVKIQTDGSARKEAAKLLKQDEKIKKIELNSDRALTGGNNDDNDIRESVELTEGKLKQLKDKFINLKAKAKDLKDPKTKAQFDKLREQIKAEEKRLKDEFIKLKQSDEITPAIKTKLQKIRDQLNESYGHSLEDAVMKIIQD